MGWQLIHNHPLARLLLAGSALMMSANSAVRAQQVAAAEDSTSLQEIIVTATKQTQSLQKVPAQLFHLSGAELEQSGTKDLRDMQGQVPGLSVGLSGENNSIYFRGVGQSLSSPNVNSGVALNLNTIYLLPPLGTASFFDLENVEALPGPQGTLYGTNSIGGIINFRTARPTRDNQGYVELEGGNYDLYRTDGAVNFAASSMLSVRVAWDINNRNGFYSNGFNDAKNRDGRITLDFHPNDTLNSTLFVNYYGAAGIGSGGVNHPYYSNSNPWYFPVSYYDFLHATGTGIITPARRDDHSWVISDETTYHLSDSVDLTYIPSYTNLRILYPNLYSNIYLGLAQSGRQTTQELRLSGNGSALKWLVGLYYLDSKQHAIDSFSFPIGEGDFLETGDVIDNRETSYATFGQVTYALQPDLRFTGGLRFSYNRKAQSSFAPTEIVDPVFGALPLPTTTTPYQVTDWKRVDYKLAIEKDVFTNSMAYANVQTGFLDGGFGLAPLSTTDDAFKPETLTGYTVGLKNSLFDNRLTLNGEAFYYDYRNFQVSLVGGGGETFYYDAQKARIIGTSIDSAYKFAANTQLNVGVTYLNARATHFNLGSAGDFSGYTLPNSPPVTLSAGISQLWHVGPSGTVTALLRTSFSSGDWITFNHAAQTYSPSYTKTDFSLGYTFNDRWEISAYGKNLENSASFAFAVTGTIPGPASVVLEAPRTYGARLKVKF